MKPRTRLVIATLLVLAGCQVGKYDLRGSPEIPIAEANAPVTRTVTGGGWSHHLFWGLIPIARYNLNRELRSELRSGETVGFVNIQESNSLAAGLLTLLTFGLYRPRSVFIVANIHGGVK